MRLPAVLLLVALPLAIAPTGASQSTLACVSVFDDAHCDTLAVSAFGAASGQFAVGGGGPADGNFLAVSGSGDATTYMDYCLEWVCPSVAIAAWGDAHGGCHASSYCVAIAGKGHATHEGFGQSVGGCDVLYHVCYPIRAATPLLP